MPQALVYLDYGRLLLSQWQRADGGSREAFAVFVLAHFVRRQVGATTARFVVVQSGIVSCDSFLFLGKNNSPPAIMLGS